MEGSASDKWFKRVMKLEIKECETLDGFTTVNNSKFVEMRKLGAILLLILFLAPTLGFCVHKHYCGDYLKEVNLFIDANEDDCCGDWEKEADCCNDEEFIYQLDLDYSVNNSFKDVLPNISLLSSVHCTGIVFEKDKQFSSFLYYKPPIYFIDIPILVQSFLI
jgi:hypothetical protein